MENFLLGHTDDVLLGIASTLGAEDLLRLELAHTRFAVKAFGPAGGAAAAATPERWSLPQEAARRRVVAHPKAQRVPRRGREPWLAPLRDLERLAALRVTRVSVRSTATRVCGVTFKLSDGSIQPSIHRHALIEPRVARIRAARRRAHRRGALPPA